MPRKKLIRNSDFPYHVSARSNNREWFGVAPETLWILFENYLYLVQKMYNLEIRAFLMMSNHFHMLVRTPQANLDAAMNYFMRETSKAIGKESGRINHIYGGPYHSTLIKNYAHYLNAYKYALRNPVTANMCIHVEDYKYSTLQGLLGQKHLLIPIVENEELFQNTEQFLRWLNESHAPEQVEVLRKGLKKREFEARNSRIKRKPVDLTIEYS